MLKEFVGILTLKEQCRYRVLKKDAAFTLLEVMIAVAIIAMSFVSLLSSQSQSISIASASRFQTTASMLARQKLAEIELSGLNDELSGGEGHFENDFTDYFWQLEVNDLMEDETGIIGSEGMLRLVELKVGKGDEIFAVRTLLMGKIEPAENK